MFKTEEKIVKWIESHLFLIALVAMTALSLLIRYSLKGYLSHDAGAYLLKWYEQIKENGGLKGLGAQVGNYNMLYQFCIAVMTYLPISSLSAYKMLSIGFDYLLALASGFLVYELTGNNRMWKAFLAYIAVIFSPIVILNSSAWAQCDSIYSFFVIAALLCLLKEKYPASFIFYGLAFAFKLQAVFVLPFFLFVYFMKRKFSLLYFAAIPLLMVVTALPCLMMGRNVLDLVTVYLTQTDANPSMYMNYPTFWLLLNTDGSSGYQNLKHMAIAMTIAVLAVIMLVSLVKKIDMNRRNMIYLVFLLTYTCILFLPSMHERYGYLAEILGLVIVFLNWKTVPLLALMYSITLQTYGCYLYGKSIHIDLLSKLNITVYLLYLFLLMGQMMDRKSVGTDKCNMKKI